MYLEHFRLNELPFRLSPDPQFLYLSKNHARAKAYMESTIWFTDGFVVITGEIGAGKTTLIETFLKEMQKDVVVAQINQTQLSATAFLQSVLVQFGFSPFKMKKPEVLATLNQFLVEQYAAGRKVLLIIDEAQNLSQKVLEEVRMLSGIETTKDKVLRIILAGQPELNQKLDLPEMTQLVQRVRLRFHLSTLSAQDTNAYIDHRLEVAGSQGRRIFHEDTYPIIFRYSGGVPRLINTLCDTSMMAAFGAEHDTVGLSDLQAAIDELQWVEFDKRAKVLPRTGATHEAHASAAAPAATGTAHIANDAYHESTFPTVMNEPPVARILIGHEAKTVDERELRPGRLIIGRTPDNDLQIDSKFVSRHHCQIVTTTESCVIEDLNSTNGIYVKSKRVRKHNFNDGDVVVIGQHEIMYMDERLPRLRATADLPETQVLNEEDADA